MRARLREDLRAAIRARAAGEVAVLRVCVAAIDNAQAIPMGEAHRRYEAKAFGDRSVEVARLSLDEASVRAVLARERDERLAAARQFEQHGGAERAAALRADAAVIARYL
jgi:uncharacterized protein YqeY